MAATAAPWVTVVLVAPVEAVRRVAQGRTLSTRAIPGLRAAPVAPEALVVRVVLAGARPAAPEAAAPVVPVASAVAAGAVSVEPPGLLG